ncbi:hypothetical protein PIIN_09941 [Serendipita indica DSM 11827]|nr:hypothetical protein PIIN_09941 [Serendipita indica DSM 11827]
MGAMSNDDHASNGSSRNGRVGFIRGVASGGRAHTGQAADDRPPPRKLSMESLAAAELIGRGGFGHVYRGRHTDTGKVLAIKLIPRSDKAQRVKDSLWREREVGVCISEAKARVGGQAGSSAILGLLHLLGAFLTPECIVLVTELCVTDMAAIRCLDEDDLRFYFGELICGVRYLHDELGYVHRDLKPSNILLTRDGHAQIADFGLVESISNVNYEPKPLRPGRDHFRGVGTLGYIPPEAHLLGVQGPEGDVWALGVILFRLATGIHPFRQKGDDEDTVVGNVAHRPLTMSSTENLSINLYTLIRGLLLRDSEARWTLRNAMNTEWFFEISDFWERLRDGRLQPPPLPRALVRDPKTGHTCTLKYVAGEVLASHGFATVTIETSECAEDVAFYYQHPDLSPK